MTKRRAAISEYAEVAEGNKTRPPLGGSGAEAGLSAAASGDAGDSSNLEELPLRRGLQQAVPEEVRLLGLDTVLVMLAHTSPSEAEVLTERVLHLSVYVVAARARGDCGLFGDPLKLDAQFFSPAVIAPKLRLFHSRGAPPERGCAAQQADSSKLEQRLSTQPQP
mmetsp:Transcript_163284/g.518903  ORF Transcript_163284/g.518903 Transcript_163284/m.518903 type:complete len:165 (-) Transcript_163284:19-513(-)